MVWTTRDKIFEVLANQKMNTKEIIGGLEKMGVRDSYQTITNYLRKLTSSQQLNKEKSGREYFYYNPAIYKEKTN